MWKVILVLLAVSPAHEILQSEEYEMKTVDDCVANVEYLLKSVPEDNTLNRPTYFAACKLEPEVEN
jgi:hypothetical protein